MKRGTLFLLCHLAWFQCGPLCLAATVNASAAEGPLSITVTGTGEVVVKPVMASVMVGVVTELETAAVAVRQNSKEVEKLFSTLREHGIAEEDIQTSNFNVSPRYDYDRAGQAPRLTGYRVDNDLRVKIRRIAELGALLDAVVTAGANQIRQVTFGIDDARSIEDSARRMAVADARRKAALYADEAGVRLGSVIRIEEADVVVVQPQVSFNLAQEARAVPIAPGQQTIRQQVRVTFAIESGP